MDFIYWQQGSLCLTPTSHCQWISHSCSLGFISISWKMRGSTDISDSRKKISTATLATQDPEDFAWGSTQQIRPENSEGPWKFYILISSQMTHKGIPFGNNRIDTAKTIYNIMYWIYSTIRWKKKKKTFWVRSVNYCMEISSSPIRKLTLKGHRTRVAWWRWETQQPGFQVPTLLSSQLYDSDHIC